MIYSTLRRCLTSNNGSHRHPERCPTRADPARLDGVATLEVDEHVWHHTPHKAAAKGPTMLTGMVDLTRDCQGRVHARLLDLAPGRSGTVLADWLKDRSATFRDRVQVATLDPFRGYADALRDELREATPVLDAFHVVKLAGQALDEVRRRVQQDSLGRRGTTRTTRSCGSATSPAPAPSTCPIGSGTG